MYQSHSENKTNKVSYRHKQQRHGCANGKDGYIRLYQIWLNMRNRCDSPNNKCYANYGGRGIQMCDEWRSYLDFRAWALSHGYADNLTLDRISTDGDYCPSNCRFLPMSENQKRRTMNTYIICEGKVYTLASLARLLGIKEKYLYVRVSRRGIKRILEELELQHGKTLELTTLQEVEHNGWTVM